MYDANFKILLFGDDTEGKKTFTQKFMISLFSEGHEDTIGVDFEVKSLSIDEFKIKLQIWDISGEGRFRSLLPTYISHARGGMFVYDVTKRFSLINIRPFGRGNFSNNSCGDYPRLRKRKTSIL